MVVYFMLVTLSIIALVTGYVLIRNEAIYAIRTWFIDEYWYNHREYYENLGSYNFMVFDLSVQHLWTKKQWLNYAIKKIKE